ncbi:MAG: response regulator transcription factor [Polaromonas sp.]|nr:response regulator transcription factor [Polaromonas sp.]
MDSCLSIVLVEDNDDLRLLTCEALRAEGHRVIGLSCAEELEDQAGGEAVDVFLIDLNLPGEDGLSLARRIRQAQPLVGIIIISARSGLQDKVVGYDSGADSYLPKPLPFVELSAALKSFSRRRQAQKSETATPSSSFRLQQRGLHGPAGQVRLSETETALLTAFARAPAGRLEHWQMAELLHLDTADFKKSSLELRIVRLRKKLSLAGAQDNSIESLRSVGYQLLVSIQIYA